MPLRAKVNHYRIIGWDVDTGIPTAARLEDMGIGWVSEPESVTLYPLRQKSIGPVIREAARALRQHGLETRMCEMSTLVWGEERAVFAVLEGAFHRAVGHGDTVMAVTLSNACPLPEEP